MRPVHTWGQYTHDASIHMRPVYAWGQYTYEVSIPMRPVNTWGQYTHEARTHMRPELTWGQYTHEARIHMRPVHPWCQYTHEASIRMRPVHTWGQYTHEASTHMRLTSKSQDAVQCTVLKYITVYTRTLYSSFNVQVWLGCRQMLYIGERTPLAVVCIEYALWFRINVFSTLIGFSSYFLMNIQWYIAKTVVHSTSAVNQPSIFFKKYNFENYENLKNTYKIKTFYCFFNLSFFSVIDA